MTRTLLDSAGLDIGYAGKTVGRGIQLTLHAGEVLCLLGPNGSGKSTLFRTLLGLQKPLAGRIRVQG
ncbi:MAG: ABC transporter ATP-binding protein, partial [Pigmentiphaga sp.]